MSDTLRINNLFTTAIAYSTLTGSTINTNSLSLSTLTVSSINSGAPGVAAYSTLNVSTMNATSTITASTITTTSNVGIGTATTNENLTVYGSGVGLRNATAGYFQIGLASGSGQYSSSAVSADSIIRAMSGNLMIQTGSGAAGIYINSSNYVGIGTATVTYPLDIYSSSAILARFQQSADYARVVLDAPSGGDIIYKVGGVSKWGLGVYNNNFNFWINDSLSTTAMTITSGGLVGIGSSGPGYLLTVGAVATPTGNSAGTTVLQCNGNLNIYRNRLIFSSSPADWNHSIYNNLANLDNEGVWDGDRKSVV